MPTTIHCRATARHRADPPHLGDPACGSQAVSCVRHLTLDAGLVLSGEATALRATELRVLRRHPAPPRLALRPGSAQLALITLRIMCPQPAATRLFIPVPKGLPTPVALPGHARRGAHRAALSRSG
jgi:hypothetical protein